MSRRWPFYVDDSVKILLFVVKAVLLSLTFTKFLKKVIEIWVHNIEYFLYPLFYIKFILSQFIVFLERFWPPTKHYICQSFYTNFMFLHNLFGTSLKLPKIVV